MRILVLTVAVALGAAACGGSTGTSGPADGNGEPPAATGAWELTSAEPPIEVPEETRITLTVEEVDGQLRAGGTAACNSYGGTLQLDGGTWAIDQLSWTEMGCEPTFMEAEAAYLDALTAVGTWSRAGDTLRLTGDGVELTFEVLPELEPASFTGTTWEVDGYVQGTGQDATVSSGTVGLEAPTVRFDEDGTFTATTACRSFTGEWSTSGDQVLLPILGGDETPVCEQAALEQEQQVLDVLESSGFAAQVDGQRLTLRRGGVGLTLRATG